MIKSDAFHLHLNALAKDQQSFKPLYIFSGDEPLLMMEAIDALRALARTGGFNIFSGDEPLLMMEAIDALRALARTGGFNEREVLVQDRYFDWAALRPDECRTNHVFIWG